MATTKRNDPVAEAEAAVADPITEPDVTADVSEAQKSAARNAAVAALVNGSPAPEAVAGAGEAPATVSGRTVTIDGDLPALVLFDRFNARVGDRVLSARKGDRVLVSKDQLERGTRIGALTEAHGA